MTIMHFINLTNGIQAIKDYSLTDFRFIRIQSTACEQKRWSDILMTVSDDFLMNVALGNDCIVYDYGAHHKTPRAVWQGLEWIKFVLFRRWYNIEYQPMGRAKPCANYFDFQYQSLDRHVKKRLDYFKQYIRYTAQIRAIVDKTQHDSNKGWYRTILTQGE